MFKKYLSVFSAFLWKIHIWMHIFQCTKKEKKKLFSTNEAKVSKKKSNFKEWTEVNKRAKRSTEVDETEFF